MLYLNDIHFKQIECSMMEYLNVIVEWISSLTRSDIIGIIGAIASLYGGAYFGRRKWHAFQKRRHNKVVKTTTTTTRTVKKNK